MLRCGNENWLKAIEQTFVGKEKTSKTYSYHVGFQSALLLVLESD